MDTTGVPDTKTLTCGARQPNAQGRCLQAVISVALGNLTRDAGSNRTIAVGYPVTEVTTLACLNRGQHIRDHLGRFFRSIERIIARDLTKLRLICCVGIDPQNRLEIELRLLVGVARQALKQIRTTN